jgi:mono/diheme cytochrome c family protein
MNAPQNRRSAAARSLSSTYFPAWLACLLLAGCTGYQPPEFPLNTEGRDPSHISQSQREAITDALGNLFGTPDEPRAPTGTELDQNLLKTAAGPYGSDAQDSQWGLYRKHCAACHGISGDGAGPTAAVQCPYPRDFRQGVYKYTSTAVGAKPVREDLERTVRLGIPGTAMLSFEELPAGHIDAMVEYVRYLSIRGETELAMLRTVLDAEEKLPDRETMIRQWVLPAASLRRAAKEMVIAPPTVALVNRSEQPKDVDQHLLCEAPGTDRRLVGPFRQKVPAPFSLAASVAKGRAIFVSKDAQCVKCHGADGKGDGEQSELYDDWNKCKKGVTPAQTTDLARLFSLPIQGLPARNLTEGVFHGGSRPIDLYRRIYAGIKGTPMPGIGSAADGHSAISPDDIWHVGNYVGSLRAGRQSGEPEM